MRKSIESAFSVRWTFRSIKIIVNLLVKCDRARAYSRLLNFLSYERKFYSHCFQFRKIKRKEKKMEKTTANGEYNGWVHRDWWYTINVDYSLRATKTAMYNGMTLSNRISKKLLNDFRINLIRKLYICVMYSVFSFGFQFLSLQIRTFRSQPQFA